MLKKFQNVWGKKIKLLHIFVETLIYAGFWRIERSKELHIFEMEIFCNIINVFALTFDQFNASQKYSFL